MSFSAVLIFLAPSATPTAAPADIGIAARYPGDRGIGNDPAVVLADDFESYSSVNEMTAKWLVQHSEDMRIATEAGLHYSGNKALEMKLPIATTEVMVALKKRFSVTQDTVFIRTYQKWDAGYSVNGSNHNGIRVSAKYPGPGIVPPADGTGFYLFLLQNNIEGTLMDGESSPGFAHIYA